ncbi:hypothetical protein ACLEPN_36710, partial [Myxococcus sp. 1LA]
RVEWAQQPWRVSGTPGAAALRVRVASGRDWFGVEGELKVDGERVALAVLLEAVRQRSKYVGSGRGTGCASPTRCASGSRRWPT